MSVQRENRSSIRLYLLGELSEPERDQVEQRLMSEDDLYQQLLLAEDELIDEYVSNSLPEHEQEKFNQRFLQVPELRQDVRFARALRQHARKTAPQVVAADSPVASRVSLLDWLRKFFTQPVIGVAFATVSLVAVLLVGWLAFQNSQLRRQAEQLQARQTPSPQPTPQSDLQEQLTAERLRNEQLSAQIRRQEELLAEESQKKLQMAQEQRQQPPSRELKPPSMVNAFVALALTPGAVRDSGEMRKISLPPGTLGVSARLDLPASNYRSYQVVLKTVDEDKVLLSKRVPPPGGGAQFISFFIPARLLKPNDYHLSLTAVTSAGENDDISYYFRVLK